MLSNFQKSILISLIILSQAKLNSMFSNLLKTGAKISRTKLLLQPKTINSLRKYVLERKEFDNKYNNYKEVQDSLDSVYPYHFVMIKDFLNEVEQWEITEKEQAAKIIKLKLKLIERIDLIKNNEEYEKLKELIKKNPEQKEFWEKTYWEEKTR